MKRLMPAGLITFLQNNRNVFKADLFIITLPTGTVLYATEGQFDITVPSGTPGWTGATTTFNALKYGRWSRGPITSEASFKLSANTMSLTCVAQPATLYPGLTIGILNAALNHLFDGSTVQVLTAYMPMNGYGNVSNGLETKWFGYITKVPSLNRNKVEFECADPFYRLNMKVPSRLFQSNCPWAFCDVNCTLSATNYTVNFLAKTGSTQLILIPVVAFTQAAGYFTQGVVKCTSGQNAGLSQTVKLHASGQLSLMVPWILPVAVNDGFSVIAGCDKTLTSCKGRVQANGTPVDNSLHHGGTPFVPPPSTTVP